jgi:hypothetical protein
MRDYLPLLVVPAHPASGWAGGDPPSSGVVGVTLSLGVAEGDGAVLGDGAAVGADEERGRPDGAVEAPGPVTPGAPGAGAAVAPGDWPPPIAEFGGTYRGGPSCGAVGRGVGLGYPGSTLSGLIGPPDRLIARTIAYPTQAAPTP